MHSAGRPPPARFWRAVLWWGLATLGARAAVPVGSFPELLNQGKLEPLAAARILQEFRQAGIRGEFFLEVEFRARPVRGPERVYRGRLWGGRNERGATLRLELLDAEGASQRWLVQNGVGGQVWQWRHGRAEVLGPRDLCMPLITGLEITAFDVQMPFLYWPEATFEKTTRSVLGRPAYAFRVLVPAGVAAEFGEIAAARAFLDTQFNALIQTELISHANRVLKSFAFVSLKKIGDQYVPKQADYRNEVTRDKTRLQITGAALNLMLAASFFTPDSLAEPAPLPSPDSIVRIAP